MANGSRLAPGSSLFGAGLDVARGQPAPIAAGRIRRIERPLPSQRRNEAIEGLRQRLLGLRVPSSRIGGAPPPPSLTGMAQGLGLGLLNLMESGRKGTALTAQDVLSVPLAGGAAGVLAGPRGAAVAAGATRKAARSGEITAFRGLAPGGRNLAGTVPAEKGAIFLSRDPEVAGVFAGVEGQVKRVQINPGKTNTFDVVNLIQRGDRKFLTEMRSVFRERAKEVGRSQADADAAFVQRLNKLQEDIAFQKQINRELKTEGAPKTDLFTLTVPFGREITGATVRLAKQRGLDTASIKGMREGPLGTGDSQQVIVLNPKNILE